MTAREEVPSCQQKQSEEVNPSRGQGAMYFHPWPAAMQPHMTNTPLHKGQQHMHPSVVSKASVPGRVLVNVVGKGTLCRQGDLAHQNTCRRRQKHNFGRRQLAL
jgi:hypothetical protein